MSAHMPNSLDDLVGSGCLDEALGALLVACVRAGLNIVISGPARSGKTTVLNALCAHIPGHQRRTVVGEVRGAEALDVLRAMACGTHVALTTVRTIRADETLPTLASLAGQGAPAPCSRSVADTAGHGVDLIVHLARSTGPPRVDEVALPVVSPAGPAGLATLACLERDGYRHFPLSARIAARLRANGEPIPAPFRAERFRPGGG